jgi:GNAT superfamily N-acetyltransferase
VNNFQIRRLLPEDISAYCDHLVGLDRQSRNDRFEGAMSDGAIIKYATRPLKEGEYLYGAFEGDDLCGVGELRSSASAEGETHAEAALSVDGAHRKQGIGARLFERLRLAAAEHGIDVIDLIALPSNYAVRAIARKFKMLLVLQNGVLAGQLRAAS